ncbi:transposon, resolvase [Clostridium phage D-1873]|uniref:Transposon, resolvase n=2 Tax=Clostridium TaxID=1485 RepID=A0A9P2G5I0_CLOBO|nr:IS607-like element ISCbt3 family transposase [Clostridium botulinum]EES90303.1 transposon, resolvase [Clostridium phage D-1873]QPW56495.1 IS607-like element ISCbt3 family transposase [Clostridium botulinum]
MNTYKPKDFAEMIGVSVKTLQRWDNEGKLKAYRNPSNRRYYTHNQYVEYMGKIVQDKDKRKTIIYARVSSNSQKDDLKNQVEFLKQYANAKGMIVDEIFEDVGSGLNYNRKKWNKLLEDCMLGAIKTIIVSHKDRFIRFGFDWFERFVKSNGVELIVVNNESLSPQEEMIQDLISIIHVFSCRIYGLRKYKKKIKEDDEIVKSLQSGDKTNSRTNYKNS